MTPARRETILIVEDDAGVAALERRRLEKAGYAVVTAATAEEALLKLGERPIDLVLLDYRLPDDVDGLTFYTQMKASGYNLPVILVTGFSNEATVIQALRIGVRDFVAKSVEYLDYLPEAVERVLKQVQTEHKLAESEVRLASIIASATDAILVTGDDRRITLFNAAAEQMFRCPAARALHQPLSRFIPPDHSAPPNDMEPSLESLTLQVRSGTRGLRADGTEFPLEASLSRAEVGRRKLYTIVVRDVSERLRAEEALRHSELQFRQVWEKSLDGMRLTDAAGVIRLVNDAYCRIVGQPREELEGQPHTAVYAEDQREAQLERYRARFADRSVAPHLSKDVVLWNGKKAHLDISTSFLELPGQPPLLLSIVRDLTAQKQLEGQFQQAQKMEAIGHLAGGVAHDFNNLLTVITGFSDILRERLSPGDPAGDILLEIRKAGDRAAALTRQLLAFSRKQITAPRVLDLNVVLGEIEKMLRRLIGEDFELAISLDAELGFVRADPGHLEQVLLNLVVNARDAMPTGGRITIETRNVKLGPAYGQDHANVQPGPYVLLAVTDTGHGMDEATQARIFEPFFTTKGPGKGTGLGLATVYGIVRQSGGHIRVYSEPGRGTTFKIYFPRHREPSPASPSTADFFRVPTGTETVLVAEDEGGVRTVVRQALQASGYTVLEAENGDEAVRLCRERPTPIHLLLTDVVMPKLSGRQLAEQAQAQRPEMKVLFMSGYTDDAVFRHGVLESGMAFLQKPFTPTALARKVREVLDQ
jgi:PAS domain S-box-containing protein